MKKQLLKNLESIENQLQESRRILKKRTSKFTSTKKILDPLHETALVWFNEVEEYLERSDFEDETISQYSTNFQRLLKLSSSNNRTKSFFELVTDILNTFHDDLIIPLKTNSVTFSQTTRFTELLKKIDDPEETEYISEAISCLENGFLKASVVLGWCAAIDKIHDKIDSLGYNKFNGATANMFGETKGRFKRFNKKYSINSISELREVFDSDLLKVIEYIGLIDGNEHTRLRSCFDMRCHAAHPGDAPLTEYNVLSFFSDIIEIILTNEKFNLETQKA